jgi:PglZ domain
LALRLRIEPLVSGAQPAPLLIYAAAYLIMADRVEEDLKLAQAGIAAADLGAMDTFRFEERVLLRQCDGLIAQRRYAEARAIIDQRSRSFWLDRDVLRLAQWQACRWMAELGTHAEAIRPALGRLGTDAAVWVEKYGAEGGWHRTDLLHRNLEAWVAGMDDQPEAEQALRVVRQEYDKLLRAMAAGFTRALQAGHWSVAGVLHQTRIFPEVVEAGGRRTAYFLVDSLRFEMGVELKEQLREAEDLSLRPAVAALPTITPIGMAALLPGASSSFSVVEHKEKLAARIEDACMTGWQERKKYLQAVRPDAVELTLDELLQSTPTRLQKRIDKAPLVVVRSSEIDFLGESGNDLLARQFINTIIGNIARAVRVLAKAGIERFVISADHGHQHGAAKDSGMVTNNPGGDTVKVERRCWIGRGGQTPDGAVRVSGAELGYDTDLDLVFPVGLGVFQTYGGLSYHHGGTSLQELIIPVLSLRIPAPATSVGAGEQVSLTDCPNAVTNRVFSVKLTYGANLLNREEARTVRVVLIADGKQVGRTEMAIDAGCDPTTGTVTLAPGKTAAVGLLLAKDDAASLKVVVLDPSSDAVLAESPELAVRLGI